MQDFKVKNQQIFSQKTKDINIQNELKVIIMIGYSQITSVPI
jgi:hypothetical protein